jgi:hypothetical protein
VVGCVADSPGLAARTGADFVYVAFARADHEAEREALDGSATRPPPCASSPTSPACTR